MSSESTPPFAEKLARRARRMGSRLQGYAERLLARNALWGALSVLLLTPIVSQQECGLPSPVYKPGEVAGTTIKAPYDIELLDEAATRERRDTERLAVPPVYDFVVDMAGEHRQKINDLFDAGRAAVAARSAGAGRGADDERAPGDGRAPSNERAPGDGRAPLKGRRLDAEGLSRLRAGLRSPVPDDALRVLVEQGFSQEAKDAVLRVEAFVMQGRIVWSRDGLPEVGAIVVREVRAGMMVESTLSRLDQVRDLEEARAAARGRMDQELSSWPASDRRALGSLAESFVAANLTYNASESERRRAAAVASVPQVFMRIPRGRVIVREGEIFTPEAVEILARMQGRGDLAIDWKSLLGSAILLGLLTLFLHRYILAHLKIFRRVKNLYTLVLMVSVFITVGTWVGVFLAGSVADRMMVSPFNDPSSYYWAIPVSAGAMLVTLLANGRVATVCSAFIAVLIGMVLDWSAQATLFTLVSSFAAIYGISKYERRTAILKACVLVAVVNMMLVFALNCIENGFSPASTGLFQMATAAVGGILAAPVVSFSLPILEWLFNVLTDIRLLELSNLDNVLLRRLSMEAPGTYNHSIIVGTLAEQAAEEIGAHALLCRVAAYYHDIGKMTKPEYFIENMRDGQNRHDKLSPRMSSLIIANHVKEGLRLAEEYNLPRQIREIIPQHHGTRLITFFYRKAQRNEDPAVPELHESDYRYPGPRPQTKEAAIFMMADSVEAAARTVDDPTPAQFEEVINTISDAIILDHQFDECDLTFSDLGRIRASFLKTLAAVHHHRISYPGFEFDRSRPRAVDAE